jgi:hypothetical protein
VCLVEGDPSCDGTSRYPASAVTGSTVDVNDTSVAALAAQDQTDSGEPEPAVTVAPLVFPGHLYNLDPIRNFRQQFTQHPLPRRFAFLVIGGKSYSGKTEFAMTLFPNPYESNAFNFNGYDYRKNGCIIFNDVVNIVDHICANKELFQSSERLATVNRSATISEGDEPSRNSSRGSAHMSRGV